MNDNTPSTPTSAPAPQTPSFADALAQGTPLNQYSSGAPETPSAPEAPATPPATPPAPVTPAVPAAGAPAPPATPEAGAAPEWLKQFGDAYKSPDEIKAALQSVDALKANQLNDNQRAALRLLEDPEAYRQYAELVHTDYATLANDEVLYREFREQRPTMKEDAARRLFEREHSTKFPGLATGESEDPDYLADQAAQQHEADLARQKFTTAREQKLADMRQNALKSDGPSAEAVSESQQAHLNVVDTLFKQGADAFKLAVPIPGVATPLNLAVEESELPALRKAMETPFADLTKEDGSLNHEVLRTQKLWSIMGPKFVALAYKAGQEGNGAQVSLQELHNPSTAAPTTPAAQPSLSEIFAQEGIGATRNSKVKY